MCVYACTCGCTGLGVTGGSGTHLLILQLHSDHSEGAAGSVVVDVDPAETLLAGFDGYPFLTGVIVDHHGGPGLADALFTAEQEKTCQGQPRGMEAGFALLGARGHLPFAAENLLTARASRSL